MERHWIPQYPPGVPAEIDPAQVPTLAHLFEESFARYRERNALVFMDRMTSYAELDRLSTAFAGWLQSLGLARGARVALMMPNLPQYPVALAGVLRAGCTVVNVNPLYTPRELEHQLKDSGAEVIVILEQFATTLQEVLERTPVRHVVLAAVGDLLGFPKGAIVNFTLRHVRKAVPAYSLPGALRFGAVLAAGARTGFKRVEVRPDDVAFLQYTGGTTGVSKGATLLHRNVAANVLQSEAWTQPALNDPQRGPIEGQIVSVCVLPLYHVFALVVNCLLGIRLGQLTVLIANPRDLSALVAELGKRPFHVLPAVNTLYNALCQNPEFAKLDFSQLRIANGGGAAVQRAVAEKWLAITGCPIVEGYGLSETSPSVSCNPITSREFTGTVGLPFPSTEVRMLDDEGRPVPLGEPGEVAVRGPQVMAGYWNRPDETAKVMTPDGFLKTGDIGIMDERGYFRIVDRKKDMIIVSGFNVYPNEVEDVVARHPGVAECAAVGVPDAKSGEALKLYVVRRDPALTAEQLLDYCKGELTGYKKPRHIEFRDELPKSNVGKILRRELRDAALKAMAKG